MNHFDTCIIIAPNPAQAWIFRKLLDRRLESGLYPKEIDFRIYADPAEADAGSGGGTVLALAQLFKDLSIKNPLDYFQNNRVLILNAGGHSRNLPCYGPEGKLFIPLPVETSSIIPPVVLDIQLQLFLKYPWRQGEMLICPGNVIANFSLEHAVNNQNGICGFAVPVPYQKGSKHGVFQFDAYQQRVLDYFQKAPAEDLHNNTLLEGSEQAAVDMGIFSFSPEAAVSFIEFGETRYNGSFVKDGVQSGELGFDLYLDVLTSAIQSISFSQFEERLTGRSTLPSDLLKRLYELFHRHPLQGKIIPEADFIHLDSLSGLAKSLQKVSRRRLKAFYALCGGEIKVNSVGQSMMFNGIASSAYNLSQNSVVLENVRDCVIDAAMGNNICMGVADHSFQIEIPEDICIDERQVKSGCLRMVYGINDSFKICPSASDILYCGIPLTGWLEARKLKEEDIFSEDCYDLSSAKLFCEASTDEFLSGYWKIPDDPEWSTKFKNTKRFSIQEINDMDNAFDRETQRVNIRKQILKQLILRKGGWKEISAPDFNEIFSDSEGTAALQSFCDQTEDPLLKNYRHTLLQELLKETAEQITTPDIKFVNQTAVVPGEIGIRKDEMILSSAPVRMDLAGGWSDTPPYSLQHGGEVVNLAVTINEQLPVQVFCKRIDESCIRVHSLELGQSECITTFEDINSYAHPGSRFTLTKAALAMLGLTGKGIDSSLEQHLEGLGGGLELTSVCTIPKGSGMGTTAILGGVILAALNRFFNITVSPDKFYRQVLQLEQMTSTAGGWQNQIGGMVGGVKLIRSCSELQGIPTVQQLDSYFFDNENMKSCFTLYYSGIQRVAHNIVEEVVHEFNRKIPARLFTLDRIKQLARNMSEAVAERDIGAFAKCLNQAWIENKHIHPSVTNKELDTLLDRARPYILGAKPMGAGGGGFILFVSESTDQANKLRAFLDENPVNEQARIMDFGLNKDGLKLVVS
ncbi:MAG: hypothetical protein HQK83_08035 [Fibrobacteria bacterium]|nr:hypothetical protein [Fibrobacteria bacterium]